MNRRTTTRKPRTGIGPAAAVNQDGSINRVVTPARLGDIVALYATGQTVPTGVDGKAGTLPLPRPSLPVSATVGGETAQVHYAGG